MNYILHTCQAIHKNPCFRKTSWANESFLQTFDAASHNYSHDLCSDGKSSYRPNTGPNYITILHPLPKKIHPGGFCETNSFPFLPQDKGLNTCTE